MYYLMGGGEWSRLYGFTGRWMVGSGGGCDNNVSLSHWEGVLVLAMGCMAAYASIGKDVTLGQRTCYLLVRGATYGEEISYSPDIALSSAKKSSKVRKIVVLDSATGVRSRQPNGCLSGINIYRPPPTPPSCPLQGQRKKKKNSQIPSTKQLLSQY